MFKSTTLLDFQFEKADMALEEIQTSSKHVEDIRQIIWKNLCVVLTLIELTEFIAFSIKLLLRVVVFFLHSSCSIIILKQN